MEIDTPVEETPPPTKTELIQRIKQGRAELEATLGRLSEDQLSTPGVVGEWSIKDHLAHIASWEAGMVALLRHQPRWQAIGLDLATIEGMETNEVNNLIYQRNRDRSLADVLSDFRGTREAMLDTLATLSDDDLHKTYSFYQPDEPGEDSGDPIIGWVIANTYEHDAEHKGWIEGALGNGR